MTNAPEPVAQASAATIPASRPHWHWHRRLYDWVLSWATTPYAALALFIISFAESSFFPIPPDVLLIALVLGARKQWWWLALNCTVASVLGAVLGYVIGMFLMEAVGQPIIKFYSAEAYYAKVEHLYQTYDYWIVLVAAFTPIPYKVFTIASGAFSMELGGFLAVSLFGRGARFFLVAGLLYLFGPPIKRFIDRYFDVLAIAFVALLIGGFVLIKYLRPG